MGVPVKVKAQVSNISQHTENVFTVDFDVPKRNTRFDSGQFLHLTLDEFDPTLGFWPESRVFSIASEPRQNKVSIVYSVKGVYTTRMKEELAVGKEVWLKLPYGDFTIDKHVIEDQSVVLIAGGTGVSPFIPYLKKAAKDGQERDITLFYGFKDKDVFLFNEDLKEIQENINGFKLNVFIEEESDGVDISYNRGRLNIEDVWNTTKDLNNPVFFVSGPPVMINYFKDALRDKGVNENNIKIDEWE